MQKISPPAYVAKVLGRLEAAGHKAWCVGGCVRDSLLGRTPSDWDITTSALPEEILACFPGYTTVEAGKRHGTIGVVVPEGVVEVTTYRVDGAYLDHRRPERVDFSQRLEDDLSRRDFTVNAMAYHPARGLVDRFGGLGDLHQGILRCVGEPGKRFGEDALRILRCLRFAATLDFTIEPETLRAARERRGLLAGVSGERTRDELTKLLCGRSVLLALESCPEVFFAALPELEPLYNCGQENPYHRYGCWGHTLHTLEGVPAAPVLRWAALLHDCGKPQTKSFGPDGRAHFYGHAETGAELAARILARLRFSKKETEQIVGLVRLHGQALPVSEKRVKRLLAALGEEGFRQLFALVRADVSAQAERFAAERLPLIGQAEELAERILAEGACLSLKDLAVRGGDLLELGYLPGKRLGETLDALLEEVVSGRLPNEKPALLARAEEMLKDM